MHYGISNALKFLSIILCFDLILAQWTPAGAAQSFSFSFTSLNITKTFSIVWYSYPQKSLFICQPSKVQCDPSTNTYLDTYTANITRYNSTSYISTLTIKSVTPFQHNSSWLCQAEFQDGNIAPVLYSLKVFALPESPTCDPVSLKNEIYIKLNCMTNKVFPGSMCAFYINTNNTSPREFGNDQISYTHQQDKATGYYRTNCTYALSANFIGPGIHTFYVIMYPDITSIMSEEMKRASDYTPPIKIGYPMALLGTDCEVKDYIKENEKITCTCYDNSSSILPTKTNWFTGQSVMLDKETLMFIAKRNISLECRISNFLNWTYTIAFKPMVLYPPENVVLNITKQVFDLCNDTNIVISGTCFVSESNPEPSITVNINNSFMDITSSKNNREYMFNITMTSPGNYDIFCLANNVEYSKKLASTAKSVTIKGPPEVPEIFKNKNSISKPHSNNILEITKGDIITCQAKGGYPILKNISLRCGPQEIFATNQDQVSMAIYIFNVTSVTCKCVIWHESFCLQNTTTVQILFVTSHKDDSTIIELSDGAISGIVIAGIVALASIVLIIFLVRRNKGHCFKKHLRENQNQMDDYNTMIVDPYVNNEMHGYETPHTLQTSYINVLPASATHYDLPEIGLEQGTTQYLNTEINPYETADIPRTYYNEDSITHDDNGINNHEYDISTNQADDSYDTVDNS